MAAFIDENIQFVGTNGKPLVNGKVYIGTKDLDPVTNLKTIYADRELTTPIANPQILDAYGRTTNKVWIAGSYSMRVDNSNDVQQFQDLDGGGALTSGVSVVTNVQGTNTIVGNGSPSIDSYVDGQVFVLQPVNDNTGAATLNIDSIGAKAILNGGLALTGGELDASVTTSIAYNSTTDSFDMLGAPGGAKNGIFFENSQTVTNDYTIAANKNAMSAGPITIASGVTVTIKLGATWTIVGG